MNAFVFTTCLISRGLETNYNFQGGVVEKRLRNTVPVDSSIREERFHSINQVILIALAHTFFKQQQLNHSLLLPRLWSWS